MLKKRIKESKTNKKYCKHCKMEIDWRDQLFV